MASLMFPYEDPACHCHCSHAFVGWNKYQCAWGCDGAVSVSGKGVYNPHGTCGGAMGGLQGVILWDPVAVDPDAGRLGLGGLGEDWAGMPNSSPNLSDSLSDSEIGRSFCDAWLVVASFTGNRVSLNCTSQEISMQWWVHPRTGILWIQVHIQ